MRGRWAEQCAAAGKYDPELGKLTGSGANVDRAGMLLDDDVMADRQAKPGTLARRFGREEGREHLLLHLAARCRCRCRGF